MNTTPRSVEPELITLRELMTMLGIKGRQSIYDRIRRDPAFPKPRQTGPHRIHFVHREAKDYVAQLPVAELDGLDAIERRGGPSREERAARRDQSLDFNEARRSGVLNNEE